jgi:CHAD domain-containing protein
MPAADANDKWISDVPRDAPVLRVVADTLLRRVRTLAKRIPPAVSPPDDDPEPVHELRVACRRARAACDVHAPLLPEPAATKLSRTINRLRRAADEARDDDVWLVRCRHDSRLAWLVHRLSKHRRRAQQPIVRQSRRLDEGRALLADVDRLAAGLHLPERRDAVAPFSDGRFLFREWAAHRLRDEADRFFRVARRTSGDPAALHHLRIRGKKLRYAIELLAAPFPPALRMAVYADVERLQELLGTVNDHAVSAERLRAWSREAHSSRTERLLREVEAQERERLVESYADFEEWWTPPRRAALRSSLHEMIAAAHGVEPCLDRGA